MIYYYYFSFFDPALDKGYLSKVNKLSGWDRIQGLANYLIMAHQQTLIHLIIPQPTILTLVSKIADGKSASSLCIHDLFGDMSGERPIMGEILLTSIGSHCFIF